MTKPFSIPKEWVWDAYKQVKSNKGAAGIDEETLTEFDRNLKDNLYKLWNRMSSGSYFPPPVKAVPIPKKSGGERILGVPTVTDRIAQSVVKRILESVLEPIFHKDSYGYRPKKNAHQAIEVTRQRCWRYSWVVEFDIKGLFDNIDHSLVMKALHKHCQIRWILLYVERGLKVPLIKPDGTLHKRENGTPQGGVISPLLANLFLHYVFDKWCERKLPGVPFCRYADDGLLHCKSLKEAKWILSKLQSRFEECLLELHPTKTQIIYCKHGRRKEEYQTTTFTFLGFTFGPRRATNRQGEHYLNFSAAVSRQAMRAMKQEARRWKLCLRNEWDIDKIAHIINPIMRGWYQYYGKFYKSALRRLWLNINEHLCRWVRRKYKTYKRHKVKAFGYLAKIAQTKPDLFFHWKLGYSPKG